jgi:hypothetical protein
MFSNLLITTRLQAGLAYTDLILLPDSLKRNLQVVREEIVESCQQMTPAF